MSDNSIKPYIGTGLTVGGLAGAHYGLKNPSNKSFAIAENMRPFVHETMRDYRACFNLKNAKKAVMEGKLDLDSFSKIKELTNNFIDAAKKEKNIKKILNIPYSNRPISLKEAIKEANATRPKLYKSLFNFNVDLQNKLAELKIFNKQKFVNTINFAKTKAIAMNKELIKGILKFGVIGASVGALIGAGVYKIVNK